MPAARVGINGIGRIGRLALRAFPELEGRLDGLAVRVPLLDASLTDAVLEVERPTTVREVDGLLRAAADGPLAGILGYEADRLVELARTVAAGLAGTAPGPAGR